MQAAMRGAGIVSTSAADALTRAVEDGSRVRPLAAPGVNSASLHAEPTVYAAAWDRALANNGESAQTWRDVVFVTAIRQ